MQNPILRSRSLLRRYVLAWLPLLALLAVTMDPSGDGSWQVRLAAALPFTLTLPFLGFGHWYVAQAHPASERSFGRLLVVHGAAAAVSTACWLALGRLGLSLVAGVVDLDAADVAARNGVLLATVGLCAYALVVLVYYLLIALEQEQAGRLRQEELTSLAREAELAALRFQLNPHFLFNSLNSISALAVPAPERAREMCVRLGDFLRRTLRLGEQRAVPLGEELDLLADYLALEQVRFGERLLVRREVPDECRRVAVPPLLLQPLVENAVKHGLGATLGAMELRVTASRLPGDGGDGRLRLSVRNHCEGAGGEPARRGTGVGLANTRRRLERFAGERHEFTVSGGAGAFEVTMTLPWKEIGPC